MAIPIYRMYHLGVPDIHQHKKKIVKCSTGTIFFLSARSHLPVHGLKVPQINTRNSLKRLSDVRNRTDSVKYVQELTILDLICRWPILKVCHGTSWHTLVIQGLTGGIMVKPNYTSISLIPKREALEIASLSNSEFHRQVRAGNIKIIKRGARTYVKYSDLMDYLNGLHTWYSTNYQKRR